MLSIIVLLLLSIHLSVSAKVYFQYKTDNKTAEISVDCWFDLNNDQVFQRLKIAKDGQLFYNYSAEAKDLTFHNVPGINKIKKLAPGQIIIQNINKKTYGKYNCSVYYKVGKNNYRNSNTTEIGPEIIEQDRIEFTYRFKNDPDKIEMNCQANLNEKKEKFSKLVITKDKQEFYSYDDCSKLEPKFTSVPGVKKINMKEPGKFVITNVNRKTNGFYTCTVYYNNYSAKYTRSFDLDVDKNANDTGYINFIYNIM